MLASESEWFVSAGSGVLRVEERVDTPSRDFSFVDLAFDLSGLAV